MELEHSTFNRYISIFSGMLVLFGLYLTSLYNYLLFHSIAEIFSILVAFSIFMIAWNSRKFLQNNYLAIIGIAYLFVGCLDMLHTLSYKGMGIFMTNEANLATQLWISSRYIESVSLLCASLFLRKKLKVNFVLLFYFLITIGLLLSIFYWKIFPDCYVEGAGLTLFKRTSEYIISIILFVSIILLFQNRMDFDRDVLKLIVLSIVLTICSELAFTFYINVYGTSNLIGHFFKILSFYLIYRAIIVTGFVAPYNLLFRNLKQSEIVLKEERDFIDSLIETARVIVLVIDNNSRIVRFNTYMEELLGYHQEEVKGWDFYDTFIPDRHKSRIIKLLVNETYEFGESNFVSPVITKGKIEREVEWFNRILKDSSGSVIGLLLVGQDVTERRHAEKTKEQIILELQDALAELKALRGLLTVCPGCNKIRDENGHWHTMEFYILAHSDSGIGRSLCPECEKGFHLKRKQQ